eukprot:scaffold833_cov177-Ochromonas_danica.AAC.7
MMKWLSKVTQEKKHWPYLCALGFCVMNGKQTILWQPGLLLCGVWSFFVATVVCAVIYLALTFCLAEMVSIIPFSGGCYGYVRCTLGPTAGFLTGCSEAAKYILYAVIFSYVISVLFQNVYEFEDHWLPVIWLAFYVCAIAFKTVPLTWSVYVWVGLALMTMITQCIFIFGAAKESNWKHFRKDINPFNTDGDDFLQGLGLAGYLFVGIDSVRTCMDNESNKVVPYVMVIVTLVSIVMGLATIISMRAYSMNPLLFATNFFPFSPGLTIALPGIKAKFIDFFSLPSILGAGLGVFYSGAKQISSMMDSGLFPSVSTRDLKKLGKVDVALVADESVHGAANEIISMVADDDMVSGRVSATARHSKSTLETIIPLTISGVVSSHGCVIRLFRDLLYDGWVSDLLDTVCKYGSRFSKSIRHGGSIDGDRALDITICDQPLIRLAGEFVVQFYLVVRLVEGVLLLLSAQFIFSWLPVLLMLILRPSIARWSSDLAGDLKLTEVHR